MAAEHIEKKIYGARIIGLVGEVESPAPAEEKPVEKAPAKKSGGKKKTN